MDYREIENRLARNREMINERAYERKTKAILDANRPQHKPWWTHMLFWLGRLKGRNASPQPYVPMSAHPPFDLH